MALGHYDIVIVIVIVIVARPMLPIMVYNHVHHLKSKRLVLCLYRRPSPPLKRRSSPEFPCLGK